ncbi:hypothetical protein SMACR_00842 [Sordaria macrospora]|uniref:Guanine deaminase n=2 Tax=Sordaria macrospora TaxID=5147 RepID=F7VN83_SORMK|nr:uncharacterized protein SMAC_00842 [Sordaria macrospora k-hell]KAA8629444.1 hypothetical protein SMACR_00842 [Sordaria macrospora]KAH7631065.1 hypothetical protein B0T09DRAFT_129218 [Sordaria sp. MPI-SDFR-AT-0083]WPJ61835.1 hypothetical protein SMAC4_00842 [Sordaria macrospora]CCC06812.1 unnamed protein product [Sordaria macrospora k-hell]
MGSQEPRTLVNPQNQLFYGTFIYPKTLTELEYLYNTAVAVDQNGTIVAIERDCDLPKATNTLLPRLGWSPDSVTINTSSASHNQFFFPGFIDTHLHAPQYPNVGIFGKSTLLDWLETYTFPLEASLSDPAKAQTVYNRVIRKTLSHGTTCAAYYATKDVTTTNLLADLCLRAGQRALVGRVCMDQLSPDYYRDASAADSVAATRESIAYVQSIDPTGAIVRPVITPRFAPSCSAPLMADLGKLAAETGLPVQTHISENEGEIDLVRELFPAKEIGAKGDTYTHVYDTFGLLTDKTILAHGVHLSEEEVEIIKARGSKVSHCPCSNSAITSGAARVRWLLERGIEVGLGTDMSGGYSPSVLEAARQAALVSRHVAMTCSPKKGSKANKNGIDRERAKLTVEEVLYLATKGGAKLVGMKGKVGGFEVGMEWDAQLIGLGRDVADGEYEIEGKGEEKEEEEGNVDVFGWESWPDRVAKWLYNGDDRNTRKVWVKGRLVHQRK